MTHGKFVIGRIKTGTFAYTKKNGRNGYTSWLEKATVYDTFSDAKKHLCVGEVVVFVSSEVLKEHGV